VPAAVWALTKDQHFAEEDTMSIEMLELNAVEKTEESNEKLELIALSLDDLDLVGGGGDVVGSLL
jgi:hypothetical protein